MPLLHSHIIALFVSGAGIGEVEVVIMDPAGKKNTVTCTIEDKGNSSYRCTYTPTQEGQHTIYVTFAGGQISKSPFTVNVGEGRLQILSFVNALLRNYVLRFHVFNWVVPGVTEKLSPDVGHMAQQVYA